MKMIFILAMLLGLAPKAFASVELYAVMQTGSVLMNENNSGMGYTNKSTFFVGHWGYSLGTRAKIQWGQIGMGVVGEYSWIGDSMERTLSGGSSNSTYRSEFHRGLAGATLGVHSGTSAILFEYYPWVQNSVIYSDNKTQNPFCRNDKLKASGFGFGFNFGLTNESSYQLLYKNLQYRTVQMRGVNLVLPNDQYEPLKLDEISMGLVLKF